MTDAFEIKQAFRVLEKHAKYSAEVLEDLKARVLSGGPQAPDPRRDEYVQRLQIDLAAAHLRADSLSVSLADCERARRQAAHERDEARTELADALSALEREREWRRAYQRGSSQASREVERLKASEAASAERERKLTNALRVSDEKRAEAERSRKVLTDQVAALHGWDPSDNAVQVMRDMLLFSGQGRTATRAGLRTAFVRDHLEACGRMREPADGENTSKETGE